MKLKLAIATLLSLFMGTVALADYTYVSENQFYLGLAGGYGGMLTYKPSSLPETLSDANVITAKSLHDGVAYRADIGYLWPVGHEQYGLEAGYMGYPHNTYDVNNVHPSLVYKGYSSDLLVVFRHNFDDPWNIAAKFGAAYVTQKLVNPQGNGTYAASLFTTRSKVLPEAVLAAGYNVSQHFGFDLSVNYIFGGSAQQNLAANSSVDDINKVASVLAGFVGVHVNF